MEIEQLAPCRTLDGTEFWHRNVIEEILRVLALEGLNHRKEGYYERRNMSSVGARILVSEAS